ncbi:MAG TPA: phosphotransferase [Solirubrobacteraceae bacterium]|nr:phosphotransferase [Solirubrobacteraceae bacterium]
MAATPIARGRAADIFAAGPDRVLRRYREGEGGDPVAEAAVMEYARLHGFPVPAVHDASGRDLILERLEGPTMLADLARRPWLVRTHGQTLADLHRRLHKIPAPDGLRAPFGRGEHLAHFDLHPDNVILTRRGPVVIDWANASRGEAADDVALTWVILTTSAIPGPLPFRALARAGRSLLVDAFLSGVDADAARERLGTVAKRRMNTDPHLLERERHALGAVISSRS